MGAGDGRKLNRKGRDWASSGKGSRLQSSGRQFSEFKKQLKEDGDKLDQLFGFEKPTEPTPLTGWLLNMRPTAENDAAGREQSCLELYFLKKDNSSFKVSYFYQPYFYASVKDNVVLSDVIALCQRKFENTLANITIVEKEDLDMPNHLSGLKAKYLKFSFRNVSDLIQVKQELLPIIHANQSRMAAESAYQLDEDLPEDFLQVFTDLREYDVPYSVRVAIDRDIRVGAWYHVVPNETHTTVTRLKDMLDKAEPRVLAFDIECTKAPLKFPDAEHDQIFMISYMLDGQGYLIINRKVVSEDIEDFEYTPKDCYPGPFKVFNEPDEYRLIRCFFDQVRLLRPHIFVTYNGDFFDWPFVEKRADVYGMDMTKEIGIAVDRSGEYRGRCAVHMDAFCWVKRDSYLPQGSQGLKAVTRYKLGYDPVEVDPEEMVPLAAENPMEMASYSVSDAVATFYLYDKYVHLFVFSLCTIIPMGSEDVLRKGSGTLCETLLMEEAFNKNIVCPNKEKSNDEKFFKNHLIENETYIGGHVECLESGVFRADIKYDFNLVPTAFDQLIRTIDRDLTFALEVELDIQRSEVANYDFIRSSIIEQLELLRDQPKRSEKPLIYHLDVAAMYPNIILTNRLQPCAIVNEATCASCVHNTPASDCKRPMEWVWRGDYYPATKPEYESIKTQLEYETSSEKLPAGELQQRIRQRLKTYCSSVYRKVKQTEEIKRNDVVCMRENPFYVNTVRAFRDRRYEYKILTKKWKKKQAQAESSNDRRKIIEAKNTSLVYDSLQLAHKCILNSFYGYVMRRGARWHSMEMAGIVTNTGSSLITRARELVEQIGRPLELDTDGIWAILPKSFPENFTFEMKDGSTRSISYPCVMLNADVHELYTNHQYQSLADDQQYRARSECSIFFELDGPYKCMVLPASTEEGKLLKKRYAVFNFDGSLAELKGFELKRRGELQLIKDFQSQIFSRFLDGDTLEECYQSVAECANEWLDVIDTKGVDMETDELLELITENRNMSRGLAEYGNQKSTSITTAIRLGEFLGEETVKDKGLNCKMIIAKRPFGSKVTERAIPTAIFSAEEPIKRHFIKRWLKDQSMTDFSIQSILDWDYYRTRLGSTISKIISIPAAFQDVKNPVPRVPLPEWMQRQFREKHNPFQQIALSFKPVPKPLDPAAALIDMEDLVTEPMIVKEVVVEEEPEPTTSVELETGEFKDWLNDRKKRWKRMRREEEAAPASKKACATSQFSGFVVKPTAVLDNKYQVLEIQPMDDGVFQLWVVNAKQEIQSFDVTVPKIFYLNCSTKPAEPYGQQVTRQLPRGQSCEFLYQVEMSEHKFHQNKREIATLISDPSISGVYEMDLPAMTRIVTSLGCLVKLTQDSAKNLTLHSFEQVSSSDYLTQKAGIRRFLLYYTATKDYGLIGLFMLGDSDTFEAQAFIWQIDPVNTSEKPKYSHLFQSIDPQEAPCRFKSHLVPSFTAAHLGVNQILSKFKSSSTPTVILTQTPFSKQRLREKITSLYDYPICTVPFHVEDATFPALTWKKVVATRMMYRSIEMFECWGELVECARYSNIPIGNFTRDYSLGILDTLYSRILMKNKHLLWTKSQDLTSMTQIRVNEAMITPGYYRTICVEIDLDGLAVNTMLMMNQIHLIEGTKGNDTLEDCNTAFRHLQTLVTNLFKDFLTTRNRLSDHLLQHFYRWVCSSSSQLYDPSLYNLLSKVMQKLFLQFLAEIRRLGGQIIAADSNKVLIATKKETMEEAKIYIEFLIQTLVSNELFQVMNLTPTTYWAHLLYYDQENYGGVRVDSNQVVSHWNMARYLPDQVDHAFISIVGMYIFQQHEFYQEELKSPMMLEKQEKVAEYALDIVENDLKSKMFQLLTTLEQNKYTTTDFPTLAGSHRVMSNVPLEFTNMVCHVLSLDSVITVEMSRIRRNLLKLLHQSEFSTSFENPSGSFVLENVICFGCNASRQLDLCRDPDLLQDVPVWKCLRCDLMYDKTLIEMRLVEYLQQLSCEYQVQDLVCSKCNIPPRDRMRKYCECSGSFKLTRSTETLDMLKRLAKRYAFTWLQQTLEILNG